MPGPIIMTGLMALMGGRKFDLRTKIGTLGGLWSTNINHPTNINYLYKNFLPLGRFVASHDVATPSTRRPILVL